MIPEDDSEGQIEAKRHTPMGGAEMEEQVIPRLIMFYV